MSTDQNKKIVQQLFNDAINARNLSVADEVIAPGFVNHGMQSPTNGPEGFIQVIQQFTNSFPDMKVQLEEVIAEGETVATRGSWKGTHKGNFMGIPATDKQVHVSYIDIWKVRDGKCVENWVQMDMVGLMQQLGAIPS